MAIQQLLQSRQAGLPPQMMALLELEQAKQALMQSGVAPGTVAGQKIQEAQMLTQPQQPQVDLQDLMPGIQQRAGQMAQAQQPVTQAQLQQAMAQRAAPGIAGLPADVNMAEGGIVGFAAGDLVTNLPRMSGESDEAYMQRMTVMPQQPGETDTAYQKRIYSAANRRKDVLQTQELKPTSQELERQIQTADKGDSYSAGIDEVLEAAKRMRIPSPRPPAAAPAAPASGVASLMGPPVPAASDVEYGRQRAAIQQMLEAAQKPTEESPQDKALRAAREAEIARQTGAIEAARRRFTESQEKQKSQDLINYLSGIGAAKSPTLFRAMAESGQRQSQIEAAREAERIKYMDLLDTRDEAVGKLKLAHLTNDAELAREASKELRKSTLDIQRLGLNLGTERMKELSSAEKNERDIAARASEGALNRAAQLQVAKIQAAARSDPASKEALAMARVQAAINGSPALKELAKAAAMGLQGAQERYAAEEVRLYQRLAPELMGGADAESAVLLAPPPAGAVREKSKG